MASSIKANADGTTSVLNGSGQEVLKIPSTVGADVNVATLGDLAQKMTLMEAKTASGTFVDFTGIPSWAKRITVMFSGVSTNGASNGIVQLGSAGGFEASGYLGSVGFSSTMLNLSSGVAYNNATTSAATIHGEIRFGKISENSFTFTGTTATSTAANVFNVGGSKTLSGTLDRIRITTVNGTDTFDAGTINIMYEG